MAGAGVNIYSFTFFTVFSFISRVAGARAHDANASAPALGINALCCRHVALRALPAAVAEAASLGVLPVAAAQDWAGCCGIKHDGKIRIEFFSSTLHKQEHVWSLSHANFFPNVFVFTLA